MRRAGGIAGVVVTLSLSLTTSTASAYRTLSATAEFADAAPDSIVWAELPIRYVVHDEVPRGLVRAEVGSAVVGALSIWESASCAQLDTDYQGFSSAPPSSGDGINTIAWVDQDWPYDAEVGAYTEVLTEQRDGQWVIVEADILLNSQGYDWTLDASPGSGERELRSILLHEFGHFLGLAHPCEPAESRTCADGCEDDGTAPHCDPEQDEAWVMHPVYDSGRVSLGEDDRAGLCALYPAADCAEVKCAEGLECLNGRCLPSCGEGFCALGESCTAAGCRPDVCSADECIPACGQDSDCQADEACDPDGKCVSLLPGSALPGDPCESASDCAARACNSVGVCQHACSTDADCDVGDCVAGERPGEASSCASEQLPVGAPCNAAEDCLGGQCLTGSEHGDLCTRTCGDDAAECPFDWQCTVVAGESVCAPPPNDEGCTCSTAARLAQRGGGRGLWGSVIAIAMLCGFRRASRKNRLVKSFERAKSCQKAS